MIKEIISKILLKLFNPPEYRKINICIVDDIIYYAKLVEVNLQIEGYENIKTYYDGETLLEEIKNEKFDLIILDYKLSENGLNGDDIINKIVLNYPDIKIIVLSGQESLEVAADVMKMGAYDYVVKSTLSHFNISNKISVLEDSINEKEKNNWLDKRIKLLYFLLIVLVWVLSFIFIF